MEREDVSSACDFSSTGILDEPKDFIEMAVWNTGVNDGIEYVYYILKEVQIMEKSVILELIVMIN